MTGESLDEPAMERESEKRQEVFQACEEHGPALYSWAELRIPDEFRTSVDTGDVVQEVMVRAMTRAASAPSGANLRAWLFGIAKNVLLEVFRHQRKPLHSGPPPGSPRRQEILEDIAASTSSVARRLARDETIGAFVRWVHTLDSPDAELLVYVGLEGMSRPEAARILGISVAAAEKRLFRLRARLSDRQLPFLEDV